MSQGKSSEEPFQLQNCTLVIPNSVTCIKDYAYVECASLISVVIPDSVTCIGMNAFAGCTELKSVIIPNSVTTISNHAFYSCMGAFLSHR